MKSYFSKIIKKKLQKLLNNFPLTYTGILSTCALPADLEPTLDPPPGGDQWTIYARSAPADELLYNTGTNLQPVFNSAIPTDRHCLHHHSFHCVDTLGPQ